MAESLAQTKEPWAESKYWQQQAQLVQVSRDSNQLHAYARAAARDSKAGAAGSKPDSASLDEVAVRMVKQNKAAQASDQQISTTTNSTNNTNTNSAAGASVVSKQSGPTTPRSNGAAAAGGIARSGGQGRPAAGANPQERKDQMEEDRQRHINEVVHKQFWTAIDMSGQGLAVVSPRLFEYGFLQKVYLSHNGLTKVPSALTRMHQLKVLDLSDNNLSELPSEIGLMVSLRYLFLFDNYIETLPYEMGNLFQLEMLGLEGNPLDKQTRLVFANEGTRGLITLLRDEAPVGEEPKPREWEEVGHVRKEDAAKPGAAFSLMSYNTLCDRYATPQLYGYTPSWALDWEYRAKLLLSEVTREDTDFVCLQEVNTYTLNKYWLPALEPLGYKSLFYPKTRARTMNNPEASLVDGCVILYKSAKFKLLEKYPVEYNSKALLKLDLKKSVDIFNRVMNKDNVALIASFQPKGLDKPVILATTHLHWDPAFKDVKLIQTAIFIEEIQAVAARYVSSSTKEGQAYPEITNLNQVPIIVCGDFNSTPDSGVFQLFHQSSVHATHSDLEGYEYGNFTERGISHDLKFRSAYEGVDIGFTNYTPNFVEPIDHIWYSAQNIKVVSLLGPVDREYAKRYVGFPNAHHPSDHVPIAGRFVLS